MSAFRQGQGKAGAAARRIAHGDLALHRARQLTGNVEAKAASPAVASAQPFKLVEDAFPVRFGDAGPLIEHKHLRGSGSILDQYLH